jgi:hypothetical protein
MPDAILSALISGAVAGLVAWGGVKVELRWLRRDVDDTRKLANDVSKRVSVLPCLWPRA